MEDEKSNKQVYHVPLWYMGLTPDFHSMYDDERVESAESVLQRGVKFLIDKYFLKRILSIKLDNCLI
jgi:hypothetical protein